MTRPSRFSPIVRLLSPLALLSLLAGALLAQPPIRLDRKNPHYFFFRGRPLALVTSGEHYGSVINDQFDFTTYLNTLQADHLNLTRLWVGPYREVPGNFGIDHNTLAPAPGHYLSPWKQVGTTAAGVEKFDLSQWNPTFFRRLQAFIQAASARGIIVEVTLFCPFYNQTMWKVSPLNALNNVNGVGNVPSNTVYTLQHPRVVAVEDRMTRKIVRSLNGFDNVMFEICNEPWDGGVTLGWQRHIAVVIHQTEAALPNHHLITQNIANYFLKITHPDPLVSVFNFHYARPPRTVRMNYGLNRVIGNNETGFDGQADATYRMEAWDFIMAGGGLFNNLDYSFAVGHERGDAVNTRRTPGGGSPRLRRQLGFLSQYLNHLDLETLHPDRLVIAQPPSDGAVARAMSIPGRFYVIYLHHGRLDEGLYPDYVVDRSPHTAQFLLQLPPGQWTATWIDPKSGKTISTETLTSSPDRWTRGWTQVVSPVYREDMVLQVEKPAR